MVTVEAEGERLLISDDEFNGRLVEAMWDVPGAELVPGRAAWTVEPLPANLGAVEDLVEHLGGAFTAEGAALLGRARSVYALRAEASASPAPYLHARPPDGVARELRPWQAAALAFARLVMDSGGLYIGDDMGLGKTQEALAIAEDRDAYPMVVAVPPAAWLVWAREARLVLPGRSVALLAGKGQTRNPDAEWGVDMLRSTRSMLMHDILVVSYANLPRWAAALRRRGIKMLVCDEAHLLAHRTAMRTRGVAGLAKSVPDLIFLSGTDAPNGRVEELLPQIDTLRRFHSLGGREFVRTRYTGLGALAGPDGRHRRGTREELNAAMRSTFYLRRTKADVWPDLPPVDWQVVPVDVDQWDLELMAEMRELIRRAHGPRLLALTEDLQQRTARAKMRQFGDWLDTWLASTTGKIVVYTDHREIAKAVAAEFEAPLIIGGMKPEVRDAKVERFQTAARERVLVCNIDAAGQSITLTAADYCAFVEFPWRPMDLDQATSRLHGRTNDPHGATAYQIVAPGTIDTIMLRRINDKRDETGAITDGGSILAAVARDLQEGAA